MSCSWNHTVSSFFRLAAFTWYCAFKVSPCLFMAWYFGSLWHWIIFHSLDGLVYLSIYNGHLDCVQVLTTMNNAVINIWFWWGHKYSAPLGKYQGIYLLERVTSIAYGESIFSFVRNLQTVFLTGCAILCSHQQWMSFGCSSRQHLVVLMFWILAILTGV